MAVTQNTLIGRSRGSVGGVTFSKWKGLNVIKSKPESVENPQTIPQQTQRNRLSAMVELYRKVASAVQAGFKSLAINQSEYNAFVSQNIIEGTSITTAPDVELDYGHILVSKGSMEETEIDSIDSADADPTVRINYSDVPSGVGQASSDLAYGVVLNATQDNYAVALGNDLRSDTRTLVTMPTDCASGDELHIYLFFKQDGSDTVSDSRYTTVTVP